MEKEFVTYEVALALKELGFNEKCMGYFDVRLEHQLGNFDFTEIKGYDKSIAALSPLKQQVFRWFREKYELIASIRYNMFPDMSGKQYYFEYGYRTSGERYLTYEEAENACIDKLIEIANSQKDIDVPLSKQQNNA